MDYTPVDAQPARRSIHVAPAAGVGLRLTALAIARSDAVTMFASMPTPQRGLAADRALDVRRRPRVLAGGERVLGVVEHPDLDVHSWTVRARTRRSGRCRCRSAAAATPSTVTSTASVDPAGPVDAV